MIERDQMKQGKVIIQSDCQSCNNWREETWNPGWKNQLSHSYWKIDHHMNCWRLPHHQFHLIQSTILL